MSVIRLAQHALLPAEPSWWLSCMGLFNGLVVVLVEYPLSAMLGTGSTRDLRKHGIFALCSVDPSLSTEFIYVMCAPHPSPQDDFTYF